MKKIGRGSKGTSRARKTPASSTKISASLGDGTTPGKFRWDVKTLSDNTASKVKFANPVSVTPTDISGWSPPNIPRSFKGTSKLPRGAGPQEFQVFQVTASALKIKLEQDGDYHLLVEDDNLNELGVEIVQPLFAQQSIKLSEIEAVRRTVEQNIHRSPHVDSAYHPLKGIRVTVTGVGFWDELHGQGGNGNGFELHPVLSINLI